MPKKKTSHIVCDHCSNVFTSRRGYEKHRYTVKGEKAHVCEICGKQYCSPLSLQAHLNTHSGKKPYQCDQCEKAFTSSAGLSYHRLTHSGERPFICDTCGKRFRHKAHLQNHCVKHTGIKSHQCEICGLAFYTKKEMQGHQKVHRNTDEIKACKSKVNLACEVCGKIYHSQVGLEIHGKIHTREKPYTCEVCGKAYSNSAGFLYHRKTHSGEKNYECDTCSRTFSSHGGLEIHKRTHTGEKPFHCDVCNLCFASRSNLHAHQRAHTRAWLAAQHKVTPKPVSASALKMRKYREKLRADPSLAPPSLQTKPKWKPKKAETLRRYREKLKALDRLRTLPMKEEVDSKELVHSVLELNGASATKDNVEAVSQQIINLLPHNLMVVANPQERGATQEPGPPEHKLMVVANPQERGATQEPGPPEHTLMVVANPQERGATQAPRPAEETPAVALKQESHRPKHKMKTSVRVEQRICSSLAVTEEHDESAVQSTQLLSKACQDLPGWDSNNSSVYCGSLLNGEEHGSVVDINGFKYTAFTVNSDGEVGHDHTLYTPHQRLLVWEPKSLNTQELKPVDSRSVVTATGVPAQGDGTHLTQYVSQPGVGSHLTPFVSRPGPEDSFLVDSGRKVLVNMQTVRLS